MSGQLSRDNEVLKSLCQMLDHPARADRPGVTFWDNGDYWQILFEITALCHLFSRSVFEVAAGSLHSNKLPIMRSNTS